MRSLSILAMIGAAGLAAGAANAGIAIGPSTAAYVDISTTGTTVTGTISDDSEHTVTGHGWAGNELFAGGMAIRIGNNGGIIWGNSAADTFTNATDVGYYNAGPNNSRTPAGSYTSIGGMAAANTGSDGNGGLGARQFIAPLWDDYTTNSTAGTTIKWQVIGNDLVVAWINEDAFAATGSGTVTFEAIFHGGVTIGSGGSLVDFVYQDTLFAANQYQDDGGSATIGYKNWGLNANANDVEYGTGGGGTSSTSDPVFGGLGQQMKVAGYVSNNGTVGPNALSIYGVPAPSATALLGLGGLLAARRRRN